MSKKKIMLYALSILVFILLASGISYGYFVYNHDVAVVEVTSGDINISFTANNNALNLSNLVPMNDATGKMSTNYLDFTITGTVTTEALMYELEVANSNVNINNYLKLYLTNQQNEAIAGPFLYSELYDALVQNRKGIHQDMMEVNLDGTSKTITRNYRLRMWIDESILDTSGVTATVSVYLYAKNINNTKSHLVTLNVGDGRSIGKVIVEGDTYGSLPIPTRDGYTFLGWNGKNIFTPLEIGKAFNTTTGVLTNNSKSSLTDLIPVDFDVSASYILTTRNDFRTLVGAYNENNEYLGRTNGAARTSVILTSESFSTNATSAEGPAKYIRIRVYEYGELEGVIENVSDFNYQLEKGSVATPFEPYYVTNNTPVTIRNDSYVLKGVWEEINS